MRIPDSAVALGLARELGRPLLSTSVPQGEDDFYTDPLAIAETFRHEIDLVLDAGVLANQPSTIVDLSGPDAGPAARRAGPSRTLRAVSRRRRPAARLHFTPAPLYNKAG